MGRNLIIPPSVKPGIPKLGPRPKGWREVSFKDILEVVERPAEVKPDQCYQLINAKRNRGGIVPRALLLGRQIKTKTQFFVAANDFVISRRQIIHGACGIVPPELDGALVSNEYTTLIPKNGLLLPYLGYYTHTIHFQQTCFNSSVGVAIEKMVFKLDHWLRHHLYLPPVEYQHEVVDVLTTTDRAIAGAEKMISAKRKLKKGLAQQLLTGRNRLPRFGKPWIKREFGQLASVSKKRFDPKKGESRRCVELEHISQGDGRLLGTIDSCGQQSLKAVFSQGDVLYGKLRPNLRKSYFCDFEGVCSTEIWVLQPLSGVCCGQYLSQLVQTERFVTAACVTSGSKMPRAEWDFISEIPFEIPSVAEQTRIAAVLGKVDQQITLMENKLESLRELKQGLMQRLLTNPDMMASKGA